MTEMIEVTPKYNSENTIDELKERLLHLATKGMWSAIEKDTVSINFNGKSISIFADKVWDFKPYGVGTETTLLNFGFSDLNVTVRLINELKTVALAYIYHSRYAYRISSIRNKIDCLKRLIRAMHEGGIVTFDGLTIDSIRKLIKKGLYLPREVDLGPINSLNDLSDFLPFRTDFFNKLTLKNLRTKQPEKEQHPVIPIRIYLAALNSYTAEIQYWYEYKDTLEKAVLDTIEYEQIQINKLVRQLRHGHCALGRVFNKSDLRYQAFVLELRHHNIPLVDYGKSQKWDDLWNRIIPSVRTDFFEDFKPRNIGRLRFKSHHEIKAFCRRLDAKCRYLVLCLSGMRSNELLQITPDYGAQVITLDGINIHLFHTKQQKITPGYQGNNDVYVTTKNGHLAFTLLNCINRPVRNWHKQRGEKAWLLNSFSHFQQPKCVNRSGNVLKSLTSLFSAYEKDFAIELNSGDIEMLRRSDPENSFNIGDKWHLTPHQLRRSLAYYLVGMGLADYPQLKQQFSHYSIAMTMYYARNASSFRKMHDDIEKEKIRQQAVLYSRLENKVIGGEKLCGGKGKVMLSESYVNRDISPLYYEKEIKAGRRHIHALAPGMYCINSNCCMRIGIDIGESVDCDWSIIENGAYAQSVRQESIKILKSLADSVELSPDIAAFQKTRIDSAEKILKDLNIQFEPYQLNADANYEKNS